MEINRILEEVAENKETDVLELPPIGEALDSDALEELLSSEDDVSVRFSYAGYEVTAKSDGEVLIDES